VLNNNVIMPIYITIYLFLFFLFSFATTYIHFEEGRGFLYVIPEIICYVFMLSFIILFYSKNGVFLDRFFISTMLLFCVSWQFFSFIEDSKTARYKFGIKGKELAFCVLISTIFIMPCFVFGVLLLKQI